MATKKKPRSRKNKIKGRLPQKSLKHCILTEQDLRVILQMLYDTCDRVDAPQFSTR